MSIESRLDAIEKRLAELDSRTAGLVVLGPREPTAEEEAEKASSIAEFIVEATQKFGVPPVDRSKRILIDGSPVPEDDSHTKIRPESGMQESYVILSAEERAKGFARPVRRSYRHVGMATPEFQLCDLTEEEKQRYAPYGYVKFEAYPESLSPVAGRYYTQAMLDRIEKGCGQVTTMAQSIAESFARDPGFYSGGYCATCRAHFPNEDLRWLDGSKVGE